MKKDKMIGIKLDIEEEKMVKYLREKYDMNISAFLRKCIRKRYNELKKQNDNS